VLDYELRAFFIHFWANGEGCARGARRASCRAEGMTPGMRSAVRERSRASASPLIEEIFLAVLLQRGVPFGNSEPPDQEITSICADFLVELRGIEPMAITGAGRSRATESMAGRPAGQRGCNLPARTATAASTGSILSGTRSLNEPRR
jgi:hypothetical protein